VLVIEWVTLRSPRDFGFYRSRRMCGTIVTLLAEAYHVQVSRETVRRRLHEDDLVWRRPRPVLGPKDPQRATKLRRIRALLRSLPADEIAVFEDEVDINTNPKIGSMWMRQGQQAEVVTPGDRCRRRSCGREDSQRLFSAPSGRAHHATVLRATAVGTLAFSSFMFRKKIV
jgi:hypothetical protein